jgi:hypothetical protein
VPAAIGAALLRCHRQAPVVPSVCNRIASYYPLTRHHALRIGRSHFYNKVIAEGTTLTACCALFGVSEETQLQGQTQTTAGPEAALVTDPHRLNRSLQVLPILRDLRDPLDEQWRILYALA